MKCRHCKGKGYVWSVVHPKTTVQCPVCQGSKMARRITVK